MNFNKKRINLAQVTELKNLLRQAGLHTVCEGARCPNIGECFEKKIATFLIAGDTCTRKCRFCAVGKGKPQPLDNDEPRRVAATIKQLGLKYAVITSVTRDDLPDGGAGHFAETVKQIRETAPGVTVEILVPDFGGDEVSSQHAIASKPDVFSHNLETVPRLYTAARSGADYRRSLALLELAKKELPLVKSGLMLGLGETEEEVLAVMKDLRSINCDILTLGQYLAPSLKHYPVQEHLPLERFARYEQLAKEMGFKFCASGPYVRSSYQADAALRFIDKTIRL